MRLGVLQGRLSPPVGGEYQEFPVEWKKEFLHIRDLRLQGLEWLVTKRMLDRNPLFYSLQNDLIMSVCLDNLVDSRISDEQFLKDNLEPVCDSLKNSRVKILTVPILDDSDLNDDDKRSKFCENIKQYGLRYPALKFAFEAEMPIKKLNEIVSLCDNFYVTYDTGNITSCGINHEEYISFFKEEIINVHIKDRTYDRQTVAPLTGDTDFDVIFKKLKEINYCGQFILQTARAKSGSEYGTIRHHIQIFKALYEKYF